MVTLSVRDMGKNDAKVGKIPDMTSVSHFFDAAVC